MAVRRGVAGVLAALLLVLIVTSSMATVMVITGKSMEHSRATLEESARRARDTAAPPALSLEASGGSLVATAVSQNPAEVKWFVVERADGSVEVKPGGRVQGVSRFTLLSDYNCQPVRVYMILASGAAVAYDPRNDPLVARMPEGWDGWWRCGIAEGLGGGNGVHDPGVWLEARGLGGGGNDTVTIPVNWQRDISAWVRVGASLDINTWGKCEIGRKWEYYDWGRGRWVTVWEWAPELVIGNFTVSNSRVDVVLGCVQGWPIALYLALRGPDDMVFSGRVVFSYKVTYWPRWDLYTPDDRPISDNAPDPSLDGPLPIAYTPMGHSSYTAKRDWQKWYRGMGTYEGSATINYRMSTVMVLLVWAYARPSPTFYGPDRPYVEFDVSVSIRVANATRVSPNPVSLDLGVADAVRVRLYRYNLTSPIVTSYWGSRLVREQTTVCTGTRWLGVYECWLSERVYAIIGMASVPEPISYAVYKVYQSLLPGAPKVHVVASVNGVEFRRPVEPGKAVEVAFPGARFRVEAVPYAHPPLFNGITTSYRDVGDRVREYSGGTHPAPSMSPWRGPALVEIETPKSRFLATLSWPGALAVTQANTAYRGYAQLIAGLPYAVTPDEMVRIARARVDSGILVVTVEQTVFANPPPGRPPDLRDYAGTHVVITVANKNHYATESIIAWVS